MNKGNVEALGARAAVLGDDLARDGDADVLQGERLTQRLDRPRENRVELYRARQRLAEPGERGVGVVALAVHQPVDEPLHDRADGLEADSDDAGDDQRHDEVAARREHGTHQADDRDVRHDDARRSLLRRRAPD